MVKFDSYTGPVLPDNTVPITPIRRTWSSSGEQCSRLQIPLKLAWAMTIHKAQGLTLDKVVINVGKNEFCSGLTYVACSLVRHLRDLLFTAPFPYSRLSSLSKSQRLQERLAEDTRLLNMYVSSPLCQPLCHDQFSISLITTDSINNPSTTVDQHVTSTACSQNISVSTISSQSNDDRMIDYSVSTPSPPSQPNP